ncbi:MAG: hypothetical protein FJ272_21970, partial [Planctomycetes bacterium]|nr:hypothetical protein [Planctomycetota bacterium]
MRRLIAWMGRGPARPRLALLFALIPAVKSAAGAASVSLVENGRPAAVIQVAASATLEHAAAEFRKYVRLASDAELPMVAGDQVVSENVVLIGSDRNQPTIRQLKHEGLIGLPAEPDSFLIKTIYKAGKNYLVLGAQTDRAALYAVYDFLERFLGAGFFWEGDRIPQSSSLRVGEIELAVKPRLPIRFYMQECPFNYSTKAWDLPDWTRELDWVAKKKLNLLMVPEGSWNLIVPCDEIIKAAKHRGIQPVFGGECARFDGVTEDFVKQHPEHKYVRMRWWNDPPYQVLHPGDLLFVERGRESVRRRVRQYGAGNVYFFSPYGEQTILDASAAEIREVRMQFADSILRILQAEDPQGTWLFWTWPFISPPWPREDVAAFLQKTPM